MLQWGGGCWHRVEDSGQPLHVLQPLWESSSFYIQLLGPFRTLTREHILSRYYVCLLKALDCVLHQLNDSHPATTPGQTHGTNALLNDRVIRAPNSPWW